jgi:hypothetical protein
MSGSDPACLLIYLKGCVLEVVIKSLVYLLCVESGKPVARKMWSTEELLKGIIGQHHGP